MNSEHPVSAPVRAVLDLFEDELGEVSFPGVDREALAASAAVVGTKRIESPGRIWATRHKSA